MKVLHINCSDVGSTGKIISDLSRDLEKKGDFSVLCTPTVKGGEVEGLKKYKTSFPLEQGLYRRINSVLGLPYGFAPVSTIRIKRIIQKEKPDVVHVHSANGNTVNLYSLFRFLKKKNYATVVTHHAEFFYTGSCPHAYDCEKWKTGCGHCPRLFAASHSKIFDRTATAWKKMKNAFHGFPRLHFVSVSPWVQSRAVLSPLVKEYPSTVILNGVDAKNTFYPEENVKKPAEYEQYRHVFLHVTSNFSMNEKDIKGGRYICRLAEEFPDCLFLVAGRNSLKETETLPKNLRLLGTVMNQKELAKLYSLADLTVLASEKETFSMPVAESLCCGTPVVGFCAGGPESIALKEFSRFVPHGDFEALKSAVLEMKDQKKTRGDKIREEAFQRYHLDTMCREYEAVYRKLIQERGLA